MIHGARLVKLYVMDRLQGDLPSRIDKYRRIWGYSRATHGEEWTDRLPQIRGYYTYEPFSIDEFPMCYAVVLSSGRMERRGYQGGAKPVFATAYNVRVYTWVNGEHAKAVNDARDNLAAIIVESLVHAQKLTADGCAARLAEDSISVEYSDLSGDGTSNVMSAVYVSFRVEVVETIADDPDAVDGWVTSTSTTFPLAPQEGLPPLVPGAVVDLSTGRAANEGVPVTIVSWGTPRWDGGIHGIDGYRVEAKVVPDYSGLPAGWDGDTGSDGDWTRQESPDEGWVAYKEVAHVETTVEAGEMVSQSRYHLAIPDAVFGEPVECRVLAYNSAGSGPARAFSAGPPP